MLKNKPVGRPQLSDTCVKELLLESALILFAENGIAATTVKAVGAAAGVTPAMVYYYFKNKDDLIKAVVTDKVIPNLSHVWQYTGSELNDPLLMIRNVQMRLHENAMRLPWLVKLWSRELVNEGGMLRGYFLNLIDSTPLKTFTQTIKQGQKDKILNDKIVPEIFFISLIGATMLPLLMGRLWEKFTNVEIDFERLSEHTCTLMTTGAEYRREG